MTKRRKVVKTATKRPASTRTPTRKRKRAAARAVKRPPAGRQALTRAMATATNPKRSALERIAAIAQVPGAICQPDNLEAMLKVLRDRSEAIAVRLAALQALQAASFAVVAFESCRGQYMAALRAVATDPDPELRQRVLGILAREKDGFAEKKLLEGLQHPEKALLSPEKALQLLSYDPHTSAYPVARAIVANPPNEVAKREALRLLAADAASAPLFESVLRDKTQSTEIRQVSAAALNAIDPARYQAHAREMVLDVGESDEVQTTSLTALTEFGNLETVTDDEQLKKRVDDLRGGGTKESPDAARRFLAKYQR